MLSRVGADEDREDTHDQEEVTVSDPAAPLHPSPRWPHLEWWAPLLGTCATLQRANAEAGLLLSPIDVSDRRPRLRAVWGDGSEAAVSPDPEAGADALRRLLAEAVPKAGIAPAPPEPDRTYWAPRRGAPVHTRYAWLLDQLSIDSTHWKMRSLRLLSVSADPAAETADVRVEDRRSGGTVTARFTLGGGEDLVAAQDWIAGRIRAASPDSFAPRTSPDERTDLLLDLSEPVP